MRRRLSAAVLAAMVLVLTGCANIPEESTPHAVRDEQQLMTEAAEAPPTANLNAFDLVREFVKRSGNPEAASMYLTDKAKERWPADSKPYVVHDTFSTVPLSNDDVKQSGEDQGGVESGRVVVVLRVTQIGRLGSDHAFIPRIGNPEFRVGVVRDNGQWRIDDPPEDVYVPYSSFKTSYRAVTVYYFDPDFRITVPDQRYVPAAPATGLPDRVIKVLLSGPSDSMRRSVVSPLENVGARTNVVPDADGTLVVDLNPLGDKTEEQREKIAAQVVLSLQTVTSSRLRIKGDNEDLIQGHGDWRLSDIKQYDTATKPGPDQQGLIVSGGRLRMLKDGTPAPGPAGQGVYDVVSAAQSIDGDQLAAVTRVDGGLRLRVGRYGEALQEVALDASTMSRPTWRVSTGDDQDASEVWTVEDGNVVRVVRAGDETWRSVEVNASALNENFGSITELRLSRDGTRAAIVTSRGAVVLAAVVRDKDSVSLAAPRTLSPTMIVNAVGVDWLNQHTLVVATRQPQMPVINLSLDGLTIDNYDPNNLQLPVRSVTAAPDRDIVVTDSAAVSVVSGLGQVWHRLQNGQGPNAIPFYPG
ncbi:LpqB family beta-propeller domain-containing protein [Actinophytocola glycyrrhizae]|uniref:LpqB family beta-propeller domain-containing protein n=1 Tax=Actinophytocola glycyrrhizae TaxID=2044873 RepID=A0ABV9RXZ1_9PSEU